MYNKDLIDQLSKGEIILKYDKSVSHKDLKKVLLRAFPEDKGNNMKDFVEFPYFGAGTFSKTEWVYFINDEDIYRTYDKDIPIIHITAFLKLELVKEC